VRPLANKPGVAVRGNLAWIALAAAFAVGLFVARPHAAVADTPGPSCGQRELKNGEGVVLRVLFAKNRAVQSYVIVSGSDNEEAVHDFLIIAQEKYGPQGINAPPLHIVSFKSVHGGGGMQIPDKAVDSCGRTLSFT